MYRHLIFLLVNLLCLTVNLVRSQANDTSANSSNVFYKCCSNSMELQITVTKDNLISYECMPNDVNGQNDSNHFLYNKKYNILFDSYKTIVESEPDSEMVSNHIPNCQKYKLIEFNQKHSDASVPINNYCVDLFQNRIILLYCDEMRNNLIKVTKVNKCCPKNYIYDQILRECIEMDEQHIEGGLLQNYVKNFNNLVKNELNLFSSGPPNCSASNQYIVEYTTKSHDIQIDSHQLHINGKKYDTSLSEMNYCVELMYDTSDLFETVLKYEWIVQVCHDETICSRMPCISKCCQFGEKMVKDSVETPSYCAPYFKTIVPIFHDMDDLELFNKDYIPKTQDVHVFATKSGTTCVKTRLSESHYINYKNSKLLHKGDLLENHEYCIDIIERFGEIDTITFECLPSETKPLKFIVMAVGFSFSSFFLFLTIVVYCTLPKLCNLHGKTLLGNVISSFMAYTTLAYVQFNTYNLPDVCKYLAFLMYFSFLSSFSWLNVMCIDMYLKIRSVAPKPGTSLKSKDLRRFILYSIFAIGYPLIMTTTLILVDMYATLPARFLPNIGESTCWFQVPNSYGNLIYFTIPCGLQICINVVLFILTAVYCNKVKNEIARRDDNKEKVEKRMKRFLKHKDKIQLNVKLFIVMGISWCLEIVSTVLVDHEPIFMATDIFNTLHGLFIFIIFVCKRNILIKIRQRLGMKKQKITKSDMTMTTMISATGSSTCIDPYSTKYDKLNRSESRSPDMRSSNNRLRP